MASSTSGQEWTSGSQDVVGGRMKQTVDGAVTNDDDEGYFWYGMTAEEAKSVVAVPKRKSMELGDEQAPPPKRTKAARGKGRVQIALD